MSAPLPELTPAEIAEIDRGTTCECVDEALDRVCEDPEVLDRALAESAILAVNLDVPWRIGLVPRHVALQMVRSLAAIDPIGVEDEVAAIASLAPGEVGVVIFSAEEPTCWSFHVVTGYAPRGRISIGDWRHEYPEPERRLDPTAN